MFNKIVKVISVEAPKLHKDHPHEHPWDCYDVMIDFGNGSPIKACMNRLSYQVFVIEQELLKSGVAPELVSKFYGAVRAESEYDATE